MKNIIDLKNKYLRKIRKGASLCIREKYLYLFEDEELVYKTSFSLHKYYKNGKYMTYQLEASIEGKGLIISSLQSSKGRSNLYTLYKLIKNFKEIKHIIETIENLKEYEKTLEQAKFIKPKSKR